MKVGSLFSGIGGFDLAFQRAGCRTVWMVEKDVFCQYVLNKHFPDVPIYPDITTFTPPSPVDVLCGGFPCQDISVLSKAKEGIDGTRSGLWSYFARLIRDLRPSYVVAENSSNITAQGLDRVLCDLADCGYDAEWDRIPAAALGAPHLRQRTWIVAYPSRNGLERPGNPTRLLEEVSWQGRRKDSRAGGWWTVESEPPGVADGFPYRLDPDWHHRVRTTGNALVPQIAEWIATQIVNDVAH